MYSFHLPVLVHCHPVAVANVRGKRIILSKHHLNLEMNVSVLQKPWRTCSRVFSCSPRNSCVEM